MPTKRKPDLKRVLASVNTTCTACGYEIPPSKLQRGKDGNVTCPKCGLTFEPKKAG